MAQQTSARIDRDRLGPPGIDGYLHIVEDRRDDPRPAEERLANRQPRAFRVRAVLTKGHSQLDSIRAGISPSEGGCFIIAPDEVRLDTPGGEYLVSRNARGELALVTRSVTAQSYEDAFERFLADLTPSLDQLAFLSNTPILVDIMEARDEANHITVVTYRTSYGNAVLSQGTSELATPLLPVYALYREALTADSNFYRFLCFYKILEGILDHIRPRLFRLAREQAITITTRQDVVPDDPELRRFQPSYVGRHIHDLYNGEFRAQYRRSVAHFALTDGSVANPSSHRESTRYARIVYLAQVSARELVRNQAEYFAQFFRAGGRV